MGFENFNDLADSAKGTYDDPEKGEELLANDVSTRSNFRDLIVNVIKRHDGWKYSDGEPMDKNELAEIINDVRSGRKSVDFVTSRYGLRAKVEELLAAEGAFSNQENEQLLISDPELFNLYRRADDMGRYKRSLDDIKQAAESLTSTLYELGAADLSPESKLGQAFLSASKVKGSYQDVDQAKSAMKRIAILISESEGFQDASERWEKERNT
ncbi:MAG: hypothetical protein ACI9BF_000204 [Candidatus Paceibacteria bacterium]|jgi:hypothetical protein